MTLTVQTNITSAEFKANPFPFYAWLRAEAPVYRTILPNQRAVWLITRYDDVLAAVKDERLVKNRKTAMTQGQLAKKPWRPAFLSAMEQNMLMQDDPAHRRLRGLVHNAFTPRLIDDMQARIQHITDALLDAAAANGNVDLIRDFALPLPVTVISEMLGVPQENHKFHEWSAALVSASAGSEWTQIMLIPKLRNFLNYIRRLTQQRRLNPQDDLTSALVQATDSGDHLSEDELVGMIFLLLAAGHETTVNLIGSGLLALLQSPDQLARLRHDPSLIRSAVEELLRYTSPVDMADERYAREDLIIEGVTIKRGDMVHPVIASANRDEAQFPNADTLDITRNPNRHLAFGQGIHYCLGAPLARLEAQIAINTLLRRSPDLRLAVPSNMLRWNKGLLLRGLTALPVEF